MKQPWKGTLNFKYLPFSEITIPTFLNDGTDGTNKREVK